MKSALTKCCLSKKRLSQIQSYPWGHKLFHSSQICGTRKSHSLAEERLLLQYLVPLTAMEIFLNQMQSRSTSVSRRGANPKSEHHTTSAVWTLVLNLVNLAWHGK